MVYPKFYLILCYLAESSNRRSDGSDSDTHIASLTAAESALIEPTEVLISQRDVLTAEPVLTPLGKYSFFFFWKCL